MVRIRLSKVMPNRLETYCQEISDWIFEYFGTDDPPGVCLFEVPVLEWTTTMGSWEIEFEDETAALIFKLRFAGRENDPPE